MKLYIFLCCLAWTFEAEAQDSTLHYVVPATYNEPEEQARFEGCADPLISNEQQQKCTAEKIIAFIKQHLIYPENAKENKIEGVVVVALHIDEQGVVRKYELIRDIGGGCGEEALRVVKQLPPFTPAKAGGQAIASKLSLPIRFNAIDISSSKTEDFYQLHWGTAYSDKISRAELTELMNEPLIIRDNNGDTYAASEVEMNFIYKNKVVTENGRSNALSPSMFRLLQKAKPGSVITFSVHFLQNTQRIEVFREFEVSH